MYFAAPVTGSRLPLTPQQATEGSYVVLEVEWPQEPLRRVRHPESVSTAMLSDLQTFLEHRPLLTLEALREGLAERTIDYYFLGYPVIRG